jgi:hypothetical protein
MQKSPPSYWIIYKPSDIVLLAESSNLIPYFDKYSFHVFFMHVIYNNIARN